MINAADEAGIFYALQSLASLYQVNSNILPVGEVIDAPHYQFRGVLVKQMLLAHAKYGTTAMLPTLITDTVEVMHQSADVIADAIALQTPGIIGIHFEGPHLSVAKKGAHSADYIRPISEQEWQVLSHQDLGKVVVTVAPENVLAK